MVVDGDRRCLLVFARVGWYCGCSPVPGRVSGCVSCGVSGSLSLCAYERARGGLSLLSLLVTVVVEVVVVVGGG